MYTDDDISLDRDEVSVAGPQSRPDASDGVGLEEQVSADQDAAPTHPSIWAVAAWDDPEAEEEDDDDLWADHWDHQPGVKYGKDEELEAGANALLAEHDLFRSIHTMAGLEPAVKTESFKVPAEWTPRKRSATEVRTTTEIESLIRSNRGLGPNADVDTDGEEQLPESGTWFVETVSEEKREERREKLFDQSRPLGFLTYRLSVELYELATDTRKNTRRERRRKLKLINRALAIFARAEGWSIEEIADEWRVSTKTARRWVNTFEQGGQKCPVSALVKEENGMKNAELIEAVRREGEKTRAHIDEGLNDVFRAIMAFKETPAEVWHGSLDQRPNHL